MYYNTDCIEFLSSAERRFICFKIETMALNLKASIFLDMLMNFN